jgi:hypothetical protein
MHALNHVMLHRGRTPVDRDILDDIAHHVAALEASINPNGALTAPNPEGNYHVTVLSLALKQLADLFVQVWSDATHTGNDFGYIIGNGNHWQSLLPAPDGWYVMDREPYKVHYLQGFLRMSSRRGMVLTLNPEPSPTGDMDWEVQAPSRKRTLQEVSAADLPGTPLITGPIDLVAPSEAEEPEEKKTRSATPDTTETQEALMQLKEEQYLPLPENTTDRTTRSSSSQAVDPQWQETTVGVTKVLHSAVTNMYRCINCEFQRSTPLGVTSHYGKYCSKQQTPLTKEDPINIDEP